MVVPRAVGSPGTSALFLLAMAIAPLPARGQPVEPVVSILADFEDDSVAFRIGQVENVSAPDCAAARASIPARGQSALAVSIGATRPRATVNCDLLLRVPVRLAQASRVAAYCWIKSDDVALSFRFRDAAGRVFETTAQRVAEHNRWVYVSADVQPPATEGAERPAAVSWPVQIEGFRVTTERLGRQTVYLDDLQVEHQVAAPESIVGSFSFDRATKIYEPAALVRATVTLENRSRLHASVVTVELAWVAEDGTRLATQQRPAINLPASGNDYRARQPIDFSQRIDTPGLYRLVTRVRSPQWTSSLSFETSIMVMPSNRHLPRGRSISLALRSNLLREPIADQKLEIEVAREIGVNMLVVDAPWRLLEPVRDQFNPDALEGVVEQVNALDMALALHLTDPPAWLDEPDVDFAQRQAGLIEALARHFGSRVRRFGLVDDPRNTPDAQRRAARAGASVHPDVVVVAPPVDADEGFPDVRVPASAAVAPDAGEPAPVVSFRMRGDGTDARRAPASQPDRGLVSSAARPGTSHGWWFYEARPEPASGFHADAEDVVRLYADALARGADCLVYCELRDDDNDPRAPERMRGLVTRDFSPKHGLLGYASAARAFTGVRYAGPVAGAPDHCQTACFLASDRHMAFVRPRPNRFRPAVLAPVATAPGELTAFDYKGVSAPLLLSAAPPLLRELDVPFFVTLHLANPDPEPKLALARPWLNVPAGVLLEDEARFEIEILAPINLNASFLQVIVPQGAPFSSDVSARALRARLGERILQPVRLTRTAPAPVAPAELLIRLTIEGAALVVPVDVTPLHVVRPATGAAPGETDAHLVASVGGRTRGQSASVLCFASYRADRLEVVLRVDDDVHVPTLAEAGDAPGGDRLLFGLAAEGSDQHAEVLIDGSSREPVLLPAFGSSPDEARSWVCTRSAEGGTGPRSYTIVIPAHALRLERFSAGLRLLAAVRYIDDDQGFERREYVWGGGLDGSRSSEHFAWMRLAER